MTHPASRTRRMRGTYSLGRASANAALKPRPLPAVDVVASFIPTISAGWAAKPEAGQFGPPRSHSRFGTGLPGHSLPDALRITRVVQMASSALRLIMPGEGLASPLISPVQMNVQAATAAFRTCSAADRSPRVKCALKSMISAATRCSAPLARGSSVPSFIAARCGDAVMRSGQRRHRPDRLTPFQHEPRRLRLSFKFRFCQPVVFGAS